jgi:hypothetical protein
MIKYATRLPPGKPVQLMSDGVIRKIERCSMEKTFEFMSSLIKHFIAYPDSTVVPVYAFQVVEARRDNYTYSYDMMRLGILTSEERVLIDLVGDMTDKYGSAAFDHEPNDYLQGHYNYTLEQGKKDFPKLYDFLHLVVLQSRYHDIHSGNILMDLEEDYRLIDLEGFLVTPLSRPENDWISRT